MPAPILATKLYIPPRRSKIVLRLRLIERLNESLSVSRKLSLISAPTGFGKTTLVNEWVAGCHRPVAWLSLDVYNALTFDRPYHQACPKEKVVQYLHEQSRA